MERLRELLDRLDLDAATGEQVRGLLAASLDRLYEGAAELQTVRPVVVELVQNCETLQGALRRQLRAARREGSDDPPFPDDYLGRKKPGKKPRGGD